MELPTDAVVAVTYRCNSKCIMCDIWKKPKCEELEPHVYSKLPNSLKSVNITGGEPFLRKDLSEIISIVSNTCNKVNIGISSNGLLTDRIEECMKTVLTNKIKNVSINISIHGIGKFHDDVMGINGAFEKAINTVQMLKNMGIKDLGIAYTATNHNIDQLYHVIELAKKLNVQYTFAGIAHSSDLMFKSKNEPIANLELLHNQLNVLTEEHLKSFYPKNWGRAYIDSGNYYHAKTGKRKIQCGAGSSLLFLTPNGDIHPCNVLDWNFGNLKNESFNNIWLSENANKFRNDINIHNCPNPCWMLCTVFPYMRKNKLNCISWILENKIKVHAGIKFSPAQ